MGPYNPPSFIACLSLDRLKIKYGVVFVVLHFGEGYNARIKRNVWAYMYEACFYQLAVNTVSLEDLFVSCSEFVVIWKRAKDCLLSFNFGNNVVFALYI